MRSVIPHSSQFRLQFRSTRSCRTGVKNLPEVFPEFRSGLLHASILVLENSARAPPRKTRKGCRYACPSSAMIFVSSANSPSYLPGPAPFPPISSYHLFFSDAPSCCSISRECKSPSTNLLELRRARVWLSLEYPSPPILLSAPQAKSFAVLHASPAFVASHHLPLPFSVTRTVATNDREG